MDTARLKALKQQAEALIRQSGFVLSEQERRDLAINDMGLGNVMQEGFAFVDILRSPRVRITILVLLPKQSLPQHLHPPYETETGKEETLRVLYGQTRIYVPGQENNPKIIIPAGKEAYYTARHEILINRGEQYTVDPNTAHWFQGGPDGAVNLCFQNRVDETKNIFDDPHSLGCPTKLND